jgi:hypothetical protein
MVFQRTSKLVLKLVDFSEFSTEKWINSLQANTFKKLNNNAKINYVSLN